MLNGKPFRDGAFIAELCPQLITKSFKYESKTGSRKAPIQRLFLKGLAQGSVIGPYTRCGALISKEPNDRVVYFGYRLVLSVPKEIPE